MRWRAAAPYAATRSATVAVRPALAVQERREERERGKRRAPQEPKCAIAARAAMNQTASVEIR